ncbi:hypothetical protein [Streptomyces yunnanensis]|uniref:hypothetical protein n=1 Tax=Streptomyces yunnanensis TaxID=156453 RepID=UPI001160EC11|nr:hypothetical protein [Streptomyces yunnanensis]
MSQMTEGLLEDAADEVAVLGAGLAHEVNALAMPAIGVLSHGLLGADVDAILGLAPQLLRFLFAFRLDEEARIYALASGLPGA